MESFEPDPGIFPFSEFGTLSSSMEDHDSNSPTSSGNSSTSYALDSASSSLAEFHEVDETTSDSTDEAENLPGSVSDEESARAKRLTFLLTQSEIVSHFVKSKIYKSQDHQNAENMTENSPKELPDNKENIKIEKFGNMNDDFQNQSLAVFTSNPSFMKNGKMRDYQIRGLNWLISLYQIGINGILADEMGLGKTVQTIALLSYLKSKCQIPGPHLIVAPKSTISNWMSEFSRWCPSIKTIALAGDKIERKKFIKAARQDQKWQVCVTSYEMINIELTYLKSVNWVYVVIDEGQRIKNEHSLLAKNVRLLKSSNRLLLTGTPLQNNLHELWSLLNYLLPDLFESSDDFDSWFDTKHCLGDQTVVHRLHEILQPFLLRRVKSDVEKDLLPKKELKVYVEMTQLQRDWYRKILLGDLELLRSNGTVSKVNLSNLLMQLRKACNHPYLFPGAEPGPPFTTEQHTVESSGKLLVLDKLLVKLKAEGSRVLLFSQFTTLLDILQDYCIWKGYSFARLDGKTSHEDREKRIRAFNKPNSANFIFLLSTRAGGLGINLAAADVVILYDSDWNPQMDLQAMDRCHRIGQKKQVRVFRLVTSGTVEEKIVERAEVKLHLNRIVIHQGRLQGERSKALTGNDILSMVRFGAEKILATAKDSENTISDETIEEILEKSREKSIKIETHFGSMEEESLQNFTLDIPPIPETLAAILEKTQKSQFDLCQFEGKNYKNLREMKRKDRNEIEGYDKLEKRPRFSNGNPVLFTTPTKKETPTENRKLVSQRCIDMRLKPKLASDFQFYSPRYLELYYQELDYFHKQTSFRYKYASFDDHELEQYDVDRQAIESEPLTEKEVDEKEVLSKLGFPNWYEGNMLTYMAVIRKNGPNCFSNPDAAILKSPKGRVAYHQVFMERHHELANFLSLLLDNKLNWLIPDAVHKWTDLLSWKMRQQKNPTDEFTIVYDPPEWMGRRFKVHHDQQLLVLLCNSDFNQRRPFTKMHETIRKNSYGLFDDFLRSRSVQELHARCLLLFYLLDNERNKESQASCRVELVSETTGFSKTIPENAPVCGIPSGINSPNLESTLIS